MKGMNGHFPEESMKLEIKNGRKFPGMLLLLIGAASAKESPIQTLSVLLYKDTTYIVHGGGFRPVPAESTYHTLRKINGLFDNDSLLDNAYYVPLGPCREAKSDSIKRSFAGNRIKNALFGCMREKGNGIRIVDGKGRPIDDPAIAVEMVRWNVLYLSKPKLHEYLATRFGPPAKPPETQ
jgi:hypothetical protein